MAALFINIQKHSIFCILVLACLGELVRESNARPTLGSGVFRSSTQCNTDEELLDLCQRCAKLTKSRQALPACCSTDIQARRFCSDYVYFGTGPYDSYIFR